jgi:nucleotide-binding universal stress UspA family protein
LEIKKILWPTDFSDPSFEALKVAKEMALVHKAELYLVHVITPIPSSSPPSKERQSDDISESTKNLHISAEKSLQAVIDKKIGKKIENKVSHSAGRHCYADRPIGPKRKH